MLNTLLSRFIATADTHMIGEPPLGSPTAIIQAELGRSFRGLSVKGSFGQGRAAAVPWIGFFGYDQTTEKGIYPVFLYFKKQGKLVLAYGVSENHKPEREWQGLNEPTSISSHFERTGLEPPFRYGKSFVRAVYDAHALPTEAQLTDDLEAVFDAYTTAFEKGGTPAHEPAALSDAIVATLRAPKFQGWLGMQEFLFAKAQEQLAVLDQFPGDLEFFRQCLKLFEDSRTTFSIYIEKLDQSSEEYRLLIAIGKVISYCDSSAANKNVYNEYEDKRTLAHSGVRQTEWVKNLLRYRINGNGLNLLPPNIRNAIAYLRDPVNEITILSENHRQMISKNLLKIDHYNKGRFVTELKSYFEPYHIEVANGENLTHVIGTVLYTDHVKPLWYEAAKDSGRDEPPLDPIGPTPPDDLESPRWNDPYRTVLTAIRTKPFLLLAGLSGTGKSRLVRTLAYKTCWDDQLKGNANKPGNFEMIPVRPNWHDSTELMGYVTRIAGEKYVTTSFLRFLGKAWRNLHVPFFLCLDEMNLAPVEQYFAEYLSIVETRTSSNGSIHCDSIVSRSDLDNSDLFDQIISDLELTGDPRFDQGIPLPANLVVIGTVNMDETTHSFSRKVLDRAMTIEMNQVDLHQGLESGNADWTYGNPFYELDVATEAYCSGADVYSEFGESSAVIDFLTQLNEVLNRTPFRVAYRVRDEFLVYCYFSSRIADRPPNWLDISLDELTAMKILSRIEGDEGRTRDVINDLLGLLSDYPVSRAKLEEMSDRLKTGYTSYWT